MNRDVSLAFVFLSGHGVQEGDKTYLVPRDGRLDAIADTCVSVDKMFVLFGQCRAKLKWANIDACRKDLTKGLYDDKFSVNCDNIVPKEAILFQSCKPDQCSFEERSGEHSIFARQLIDVLVRNDNPVAKRGGTHGNYKETVTLNDIFEYVREETIKAASVEYNGSSQTPSIKLENSSYDPVIIGGLTTGGFSNNRKKRAAELFDEAIDLWDKDPERSRKDLDVAARLDPKETKYKDWRKKIYAQLGRPIPKDIPPGAFRTIRLPNPQAPDKTIEMRFHYCPVGVFLMSSGEVDAPRDPNVTYCDDLPVETRIDFPFWILETEVSQEMWNAVMEFNPSRNKGNQNPVESVSLEDCLEFANRLNRMGFAPKGFRFALPTEEQWEYACRAGTTTAFNWDANVPDKTKMLYKETRPMSGLTDPANKPNNKNAWGLVNMHGNVFEWCSNNVEADRDSVQNAKFVPVMRGGSFVSSAPECASLYRGVIDGYDPEAPPRMPFVGFRIVLVPNDELAP